MNQFFCIASLLAGLVLGRTAANNFRANYVGRFQYFYDFGGRFTRPTVQAFCKGEITVLSTSDPSIVCSPLSQQDVEDETLMMAYNDGGGRFTTGVECVNTCTDYTACAEVYIEATNSFEGQFGEVFFQCQGPTANDVQARFAYVGNINANDSSLNIHITQLGVFCPDPSIPGNFIPFFDDYFFECAVDNDISNYSYEYYSCFARGNRNESPYLVVDAHVARFDSGCIQTTTTDAPNVSAPTVPVADYSDDTYTVRFQANCGVFPRTTLCTGPGSPPLLNLAMH